MRRQPGFLEWPGGKRGIRLEKFVVKYGGSIQKDEQTRDDLLEEIAYYAKLDGKWAVVHGGGSEISQWLARVGHASDFKNGQRITDELTLAIAEMVLGGRVGKSIMRELEKQGAKAISISGEDHGLLLATPFDQGIYGHVGAVKTVDTSLITLLWDAGYIPVIAPLGVDAERNVYNINADVAAGHIAGALAADILILATDVPGVKESPDSLYAIPELTVTAAKQMIKDGRAVGGMIPKLESAIQAMDGGVKTVVIASGKEQGLIDQILRGQRIGTRIVQDKEGSVHHA